MFSYTIVEIFYHIQNTHTISLKEIVAVSLKEIATFPFLLASLAVSLKEIIAWMFAWGYPILHVGGTYRFSLAKVFQTAINNQQLHHIFEKRKKENLR